MKMGMCKQLGVVVALAFMLSLPLWQNAGATSSITVGSAEVTPGQVDVMLPVCLNNEVQLRGVVIPLLIRKLGPAFPTKVRLSIGDRMVGRLTEIVSYKWFNTGTVLAQCKRYSNDQPNGAGGFPGVASLAVIADSTDKVPKQDVTESPYGVFWTRNTLFNNLPIGRDQTGSFIMDFDVDAFEGCFEIDSTCSDPANHILLVNPASFPEPSDFSPGAVIVGSCTGTALDMPAGVAEAVRDDQAATLTWNEVAGATAYEVQIDETDNTFSNLTVDVFVQSTSYTYTVGDEQTIFWRVRAAPHDCGSCFSPWAGPQAYTDVQTIASSGIPESYDLNQNYPNPFNASTVIEFTNKHDGNVTLQVFNILGQNVVTLMDEYKSMGKYAVTWDGTDSQGNAVPSGMYFYRVSTDDFSAVKKMTLLK